MIKLLIETYQVQFKLYEEDEINKILINTVTQIEKLVEKRAKLRKLNIEDQLELGQILNWNDRKISIVCAKKLKLNKSIIYNLNNFEDLYVSKNPELRYEINNNILILTANWKSVVMPLVEMREQNS
jgi:hypothetical protein